ncbi:DinB family protein [Candidatus Bathyarchaeota archaeon]|jgi:hypothetical protein|nr:DinB family protein [Candidatus Bathyarchaeota archaeon]MBT4320501.1 DinB family protein [Candidatus Bathyarchaeota archaeon]MBT4424911.1 DinB family protein [Candidatus Bathyarchaeota archaeon]MBT6605329.1 DinB family protein [Candidatus Bathyarchaeota archaeon]MBT7186889.1 DinB family protein [Candidatus Bathyarchaeota archaeon]
MSEASTKISDSIIENLALTWQMYSDAINTIPDEEWGTGEIDYLVPARQILHGIETLDFYSVMIPDVFTHGYRFNLDWQTASIDQLPSKEQLMKYLDEVKEKLENWILGIDDDLFHSPERLYPWTGSTLLGRVLYSLEHSRHHLGELNGELRRRGLPRVKWSYFKQ